MPPFSQPSSLYEGYQNPLSFQNPNSWNQAYSRQNMFNKGHGYHPYDQAKVTFISKRLISTLKIQSKAHKPISGPLDALQSCVTNLNPSKVASSITAKKDDCPVKTVSRVKPKLSFRLLLGATCREYKCSHLKTRYLFKPTTIEV